MTMIEMAYQLPRSCPRPRGLRGGRARPRPAPRGDPWGPHEEPDNEASRAWGRNRPALRRVLPARCGERHPVRHRLRPARRPGGGGGRPGPPAPGRQQEYGPRRRPPRRAARDAPVLRGPVRGPAPPGWQRGDRDRPWPYRGCLPRRATDDRRGRDPEPDHRLLLDRSTFYRELEFASATHLADLLDACVGNGRTPEAR